MPDFKYIYSRLRHQAEVFQVFKRQIRDLNIDIDLLTLSHANRKTYTNKYVLSSHVKSTLAEGNC